MFRPDVTETVDWAYYVKQKIPAYRPRAWCQMEWTDRSRRQCYSGVIVPCLFPEEFRGGGGGGGGGGVWGAGGGVLASSSVNVMLNMTASFVQTTGATI